VTWREGVAEPLRSRFVALRVRPATGDHRRDRPRAEHWLLAEWPKGETEPSKFWFSNLPADTTLDRLVYLAKLRWLIERDYLELKQELGLGHYEGRGWPGFHHHAALCIAAYGFLIAERAAIPPSKAKTARLVEAAGLPDSYRPRGSPAANPAPRAQLDRHASKADRTPSGQKPAKMSVLCTDTATLVTQ
jgi:SRSO17 transposase